MLIRFMLIIFCAVSIIFVSAADVYAASSEEYVDRANEYIKKGEIKAAVIELKNALQKDSKNVKARVLLGEAYLKLGDGASAEKELDRAKRLGENTHYVQVLLGRSYLLQRKIDEVINDIKDNESYPVAVRAEILTLQAQAFLLQNNKVEAKKLYQRAVELDVKSINAQLGLVRLAIIENQLDDATTRVKKVIEKNPNSDEAWSMYAEITRLSGDNKVARERFDKALTLEPNNISALLGKVSTSIALNELDTAIATTDMIFKLVPNHPMANYFNAIAKFKKGDTEAAEESIQKVLKVIPNHIPSLQIIGSIYFAKQKYEQAIQSLTQVLRSNPANVAAVKVLSAAYLKSMQPKQAIEILAPIAEKSTDPQLIAMLGSAYMQDRQNDKGMELLEKAMELDPKATGIQTQLAIAQLISGENDKAIAQLESVVELSPDLMQAEIMLTMVHMRNKDFQKALDSAINLQKKNVKDPVPLNLMGAAYLGLDNKKKAREHFEAAINIDTKFVPAMINLAKMDEQEGRIEDAKSRYTDVLKFRPGHVRALMSLARLSENTGDLSGMLKYVEKAYDLNPDDVVPGLFLVRYHLSRKDPLKALSVARILKDKAPENPEVLKALATAQITNKEYSSAIATYESMAKVLPKSPEPSYLIGAAYMETNDPVNAKKQFEKSLSLKSDYLLPQLSIIDLELKANNVKQALSVSKNIQKQYPKQPIGYQLEGDIYVQTNDYDKAIAKYKEALNKLKSSELTIKLSTAYSKSGKNKESYQLLEDWLKKNDDDQKVALLLANNYQVDKQNDKAIEKYLRVLKMDANNIVALNNIAWLFQLTKDPRAIEYAERAYTLMPNNPAVADTYGWLLINEEKVNKGLTILQQAVVQAPHLHDIRYHLAVAMYKSGKPDDATKELERLLKQSSDFSEVKAAQALLNKLRSK